MCTPPYTPLRTPLFTHRRGYVGEGGRGVTDGMGHDEGRRSLLHSHSHLQPLGIMFTPSTPPHPLPPTPHRAPRPTPHAESIPQPPRLSPPRGAEIALACRRPRTRSYDLEVSRSLWHADDLARSHMTCRTELASLFSFFPLHGGVCVCTVQPHPANLPACTGRVPRITANHRAQRSPPERRELSTPRQESYKAQGRRRRRQRRRRPRRQRGVITHRRHKKSTHQRQIYIIPLTAKWKVHGKRVP